MNKRVLWSRILCIAGIVVSVLGGRSFWIGLRRDGMSEFCLLSGSGLVALGTFVGKSRYRRFAYSVLGFAVMSVSAWIAYCLWVRTYLPEIYWLGLMANLTGAVLVLFEPRSASMPALGDISISTRRRWWSDQVSVSGLVMMPIVILMFLGSLWVVGPAPGLFFIIFYTFILAGSGLPALSAFLGKSRYRKFLYVALVLTVCGMIAALLLVFYDESRAPWSAIFFFAYPLGLIMSCVGAALVSRESLRRPPVSDDTVETV